MSKKPNPLEKGLDSVLGSFAQPAPSAPPSPAPSEGPPAAAPTPAKAGTPAKPATKAPKGKKSNADYYPTTVLMRKTVVRRVKQALLAMDSKMDVSDVVEMLLEDWLKERNF